MNKEKRVGRYREQMEWLIYASAYLLSFLLARGGHSYGSGFVLIAAALCLYGIISIRTGDLVNLEGLLSLSFIGGQGVACLKLSHLQQNWNLVTWLCFFLVYCCFRIGYQLGRGKKNALEQVNVKVEPGKNKIQANRIYICCLLLAGASVLCFLLEAAVVGYIPLFSELPHAYSYFHISGVHYFTISCILIPGLTVVYSKISAKRKRVETILLAICNVVAAAIPILCVSRFQLIFAIGFALVVYIAVYRKIKLKTVVILVVIMIPLYALLTLARNHDVAYLNGIFEMRSKSMPIYITQPYMYIANNYENFNCMVEQLTQHTYGLRMLFPVFALTGLKFVFPQLIAFPVFTTKEELTTLTMFYDAYYDFGIIGIILFSCLLGFVARKLANQMNKGKNPVIYLLYGQIAVYFGLSFFTTWFSNPTTWFWLALTVMMYLFVGYQKKEKRWKNGA